MVTSPCLDPAVLAQSSGFPHWEIQPLSKSQRSSSSHFLARCIAKAGDERVGSRGSNPSCGLRSIGRPPTTCPGPGHPDYTYLVQQHRKQIAHFPLKIAAEAPQRHILYRDEPCVVMKPSPSRMRIKVKDTFCLPDTQSPLSTTSRPRLHPLPRQEHANP